MKAQIQDFGGIKHADIDFLGDGKITLLVGDNGVGKSSIAEAVAYCLTGTAYDAERPKNRAWEFVRTGSASGARIRLSDDLGEAILTYPDCKHIVAGMPPTASHVAAGLVSICKLKLPERAALLHETLKTLPTDDELRAALKEVGVPPASIEAVVDYVQKYGWDKAFEHYKNQGAMHKSLWSQVAGEVWGSDKQHKFVPRFWEDSLTGMSEQTLADDLAREREVLETSLKFEAVSESELENLKAYADGLEGWEKGAAEAEATYDEVATEYRNATDELKALPRPGLPEKPTDQCPHCQGDLVVTSLTGKVRAPIADTQTEEERDQMTAAIMAQTTLLDELSIKLRKASEDLDVYRSELYQAQKAVKRLESIAGNTSQAPPKEIVEKQRRNVERAEQRLAAWQQKTKADLHVKNISQALYTVGVLKQDGLRMSKQQAGLKKFNTEYLEPICQNAGWGTVQIEPDLNITYDGRSYHRLSGGQKWRCRMTLQLALAWQQPCSLLVIDDDVQIDDAGRGGLVDVLETFPAPSLLCFVISKQHDIPDLSDPDEWGCGQTLVFEDGVVKPFRRDLVTA